MDVNVLGPMRVVKHFLPLIYKGEGKAIINISSEAGSIQNAYGGDFPYGISKAALNMFSVQLSRYVNEKNITVYAIHPGWIKTDMGGEDATGYPDESANGILDILEGKIVGTSELGFIDFKGREMKI
ncbi:SDR family NAD(P)-dependent oxidoreductase [Niallia circulans]